ncbi:hypothetical protein SteCoe_10817 [Stentor coeruleus]|uniref:Uncharacterized protein n=1 Tax=Stentor coeruleus TaxID=5963 RepID=A0A1R2CEQ7_9CILI|nr:hypothetical protein SteCoe_10817 [Stentor coeruleus]
MEKIIRKTEGPVILSPKPMRITESILRATITNPFDTISPLQRSFSCDQENEVLHSELSCILNSFTSFPTSKSLPSPLFSRLSERPPTRHRINPIIYDEKFLNFESSSTASEDL